MDQHLDAFVEAHPAGWDHAQWLGLLADLEQKGFDVSDSSAVGRRLERQRLVAELRRLEISGLGPKRIEAIASHFGTWWGLRHAEVTDFAELKTVPTKLAGKLLAEIR